MRTKRLSKDRYYLLLAKDVSRRATCLRRKFGAIIVAHDEIISSGYCGSPRGAKNCVEQGSCIREKLNIPSGERYEYCKSVHAEQNAIISVARRDAMGGTLYLSGENLVGGGKDFWIEPCILCKKMIINAGIERVVAGDPNGDIIEFKVKDWLKNEAYMTYGNKKSGRKIQRKEKE